MNNNETFKIRKIVGYVICRRNASVFSRAVATALFWNIPINVNVESVVCTAYFVGDSCTNRNIPYRKKEFFLVKKHRVLFMVSFFCISVTVYLISWYLSFAVAFTYTMSQI
jgi:hypothetical protein